MKNRTLLAIVCLVSGCGNGSGGGGGSSEVADGNGSVADGLAPPIDPRFGARAPRTCADKSAPARGAITAGWARKYFICKAEYEQGGSLHLVENVKVQVGGGVPYTPNLGAFPEIDVTVPLYPIRGSLVSYSCQNLITSHTGPPETSCYRYEQPNPKGYCYKTTFKDWDCYMADTSNIAGGGPDKKGPPPSGL